MLELNRKSLTSDAWKNAEVSLPEFNIDDMRKASIKFIVNSLKMF